MRNSKFRGSFGDLKQGKSGNVRSPNRYRALASPDLENEVCFPSLPAAIPRAPTKDPRTAVKIGESSPSIMTSTGDYDHAEEGRRLEKLIVAALNRAKKGLSPLSQEEVNHFQTWLANYRAANAQNQSQIPRLGGSNLTSNPNLESEGAVVVSEDVKRETVLPFSAAFEGHKGNLEDAETDVEKIYEVTKPCSLDPEAMEKTKLENFFFGIKSNVELSDWGEVEGEVDDPLEESEALSPVAEGLNGAWDCRIGKIVPFSRSSPNHDDVFIMDTKEKVFNSMVQTPISRKGPRQWK
ncbi:hypothetical protein U1Q18_037822 [Sarracenia purpurea var. burkii]